MKKLEILAVQIQTDINDALSGLRLGVIGTEEMIKELVKINIKIKTWGKEANAIMDEATATEILEEDSETERLEKIERKEETEIQRLEKIEKEQ